MDDAAAFKATFSGFKSLTSGGLRVYYDVDGPQIKKALEVLAHGGMPSAAKGDWFVIARLNQRNEAGDCDDSLKSGSHALFSTTKIAQGPQLAKPSPGRSLSQRAALLCNDAQFRLFLERTYLPNGNYCNNAETAAEIVRLQCGVDSRADIIPGTSAADKFDRLLGNFTVWKHADKYVEQT